MITDIFDKIKNTSSINEKIKILQDNDSELLRKILWYAYDKRTVFDITSSQAKQKTSGIDEDFPLLAFQTILNTSGRIEKQNVIKEAIGNKHPNIQKYFLNVLDKDLGIGLNIKTINKAFPELIKEFKLMLAQKQTKELYHRQFSDTKTVFVNIKIDGIRCVTIVKDENDISFYSRDGAPLSDFLTENFRSEIVKNIGYYKGKTIDGEIYCSNFQQLMTIVMRKDVTSEAIRVRNTARYAVFDVLTEDTLDERIKVLQDLPSEMYIKPVKYVTVNNDYQLLFDMSRHYIDKGAEGIIVKHPKSLYEYKRSNNWLKFKNKESLDLTIIGVEQGEGKCENALGAFILDYNGKELRCGSGFTDEERIKFWNDKEKYIGKTAQISFMEKTKTDSLRHPVFEVIRFDK
jgi:DNA ligase-1